MLADEKTLLVFFAEKKSTFLVGSFVFLQHFQKDLLRL
jgi:hypothetical protein